MTSSVGPFDGLDLWSVFEQRAARSASRPFLTWQPIDQPSATWTYAEVHRQARALAAGMQARGVGQGERVLIHLDNTPEFFPSWLACAALGAIAVTTNTRSTQDELAYYAADAGVTAAITQPRHAELVSASATDLRWLVSTDHDSGVTAAGKPSDAYAGLLGDPDSLVRTHAADPRAPLMVQYTSGTTSRPKGVVWSNANALWAAKVNSAHEALGPDDCHLVYTPTFHANATVHSILPTIWVGGRLVLIPKWSTSRFWDISVQHGCTWTTLIGLSIKAILDQPAPERHSYRMFGGPICLEEFPNAAVKAMGWWGMTETACQAIVGDVHLPNRDLAIGRPAPEYGIRVLRDDGTPVDTEETGHLQVKGVPGLSLFTEYLGKPAETAASFTEDGWFTTGDLVALHADGFLTFMDRDKDMLKVGAENVAASEVERVISAVPGVLEAAVVGRPDDKLDEVPVAFVKVAAPDPALEATVIGACGTMLADFKVPRAVYAVAELPRSTIGKVSKRDLRAVSSPDADREKAEARWVAEALVDPSGDAR